ncbi:MAG: hypothetical protein HY097_05790 [Nitrospinae bacterium]|nr:hypothetical protein [Nitrospinota bacterium]MBI3815748.1 hypothetical protein [Nitrospinota bacterium]
MAQEVATIKIFPEEQIQVIGFSAVTLNTLPMWGVARVGDKKPTGFRKDIVPANKIPNRIPKIPCQLIAVGFDNNGSRINGGDVKEGFIYSGAKLPNGKTAQLKWNANNMKNGKWTGGFGDNRNPQAFIEESAGAGAAPTKWLGFSIDDTGLLIPGNDGILEIPANTEIGDTKVKFNNPFHTDRTCDGFVKVDYSENDTFNLKSAQIKAVIAQPDWAVEKDNPNGWALP